MSIRPGKYLVTGGAGFVGSHLCEALLHEGCQVVVIDDLSAGKLSNLEPIQDRITFIQASINDLDQLKEAANSVTGVFHLAADVSVPRSIKEPQRVDLVNAHGTLNVVLAAQQNNAKIVFSSSAAVYGDTKRVPVDEEDKLAPISPYGVQKLTGENYIRAYHKVSGLKGVCLRYFNIYGPRQDPTSPYSGVISIFISKAINREKITVHGDGLQTRDFVYVADIVQANIRAMGSQIEDGRALNIGTGKATSLIDLGNAICEHAGHTFEPLHSEARTGDIRHSVARTGLAHRDIGFEARWSLVDGLASTIRTIH